MGKGNTVRNEAGSARFSYLDDYHLGGIEQRIAAGKPPEGRITHM